MYFHLLVLPCIFLHFFSSSIKPTSIWPFYTCSSLSFFLPIFQFALFLTFSCLTLPSPTCSEDLTAEDRTYNDAAPGRTRSSLLFADTLLEVILRSDLAAPRPHPLQHVGREVIAGNSWSSVTSQEIKERRSVRCQQSFSKHKKLPMSVVYPSPASGRNIVWGFRFSRRRAWRWESFLGHGDLQSRRSSPDVLEVLTASIIKVASIIRANLTRRPDDGSSTYLWNVGTTSTTMKDAYHLQQHQCHTLITVTLEESCFWTLSVV
jgi:hypothetical protein